MKKVLALLLSAVMLLSLTVTAVNAEGDDAASKGGYFIIGTMTDWKFDPGYKIADGLYSDRSLFFTILLTPDDSFKIVYSPDGKTLDNATYYPEGRGNAFNQEYPIVPTSSFFTFEFRPACDGGITYTTKYDWYNEEQIQTWYYDCIFCIGYDPWIKNARAKLPNPDPEHKEPEPGYYIVGTMTDWELNKSYKFGEPYTQSRYTAYVLSGFTLRLNDKFKVAYSEDGVNITRWYPEGEGNAYNEDRRRIYKDTCNFYLYFTPNGDGDKVLDSFGDPHYGVISILEYDYPSEPEGLPIPVGGELFKAKLKADYSLSDKDFSEYEELCYHKDKEGLPDWTLVKVKTTDASEQTYSDIIANRVCEYESSSSLFGSGYGIYDAAEKRFIPLTDDIVRQYKDLGRIFDSLGGGRLIGDIDSDDELTAIDCTLIQRCATRIRDWPEDDIFVPGLTDGSPRYYSDFDRDGERDIVDATRLQRYVTNID